MQFYFGFSNFSVTLNPINREDIITYKLLHLGVKSGDHWVHWSLGSLGYAVPHGGHGATDPAKPARAFIPLAGWNYARRAKINRSRCSGTTLTDWGVSISIAIICWEIRIIAIHINFCSGICYWVGMYVALGFTEWYIGLFLLHYQAGRCGWRGRVMQWVAWYIHRVTMVARMCFLPRVNKIMSKLVKCFLHKRCLT